jgi:hypothetical protein
MPRYSVFREFAGFDFEGLRREASGAGAGASAVRTTPAVTAVSQKINFKPTLNVEVGGRLCIGCVCVWV